MNREWIKEDDAQNEVGSCCHFAIKTWSILIPCCCLMLFVHLIPLSCTDPAFFWRFFLIESRDGTRVWPPKGSLDVLNMFERLYIRLYYIILFFFVQHRSAIWAYLGLGSWLWPILCAVQSEFSLVILFKLQVVCESVAMNVCICNHMYARI